MQAIEITNGHKSAVVSQDKVSGRYFVIGRNGGSTKTYKQLKTAIANANKYVGL